MSEIILEDTVVKKYTCISTGLSTIFYPLYNDVISIIIGMLNYFDFRKLISIRRNLNTVEVWRLYLSAISEYSGEVIKHQGINTIQSLCMVTSLETHYNGFYNRLPSEYFCDSISGSEFIYENIGSDILSGRTVSADFIYYLAINNHIDPLVKEKHNLSDFGEIYTKFCNTLRSDIRAYKTSKDSFFDICSLLKELTQEYFTRQYLDSIVFKRMIENTKYIDPLYILTHCIDYDECDLRSTKILKILKYLATRITMDIQDASKILEKAVNELRYNRDAFLSIHKYYNQGNNPTIDHLEYPDEGFDIHYENGSVKEIVAYFSFRGQEGGIFHDGIIYSEIDPKGNW